MHERENAVESGSGGVERSGNPMQMISRTRSSVIIVTRRSLLEFFPSAPFFSPASFSRLFLLRGTKVQRNPFECVLS